MQEQDSQSQYQQSSASEGLRLTAFLKGGIPLAKADFLRPLLEVGSERLTFSTHLASYIPFVLEVEREKLKEELKEKPFISVIFDGSMHLGEMLVVLVRFVDCNLEICQRLVRVHVLAKSLNAQQLAREIITTLSTDLQYPSDRMLGVVRDGASVNGAAVKILRDALYTHLTNIICIPHSLDLIGRHFDTDLLESFCQSWVALFAHSPASRLAWKSLTGEGIRSYSASRWWSWLEALAQLHHFFAHVMPFPTDLQSCPTTVAKLRLVLGDIDQLCAVASATCHHHGRRETHCQEYLSTARRWSMRSGCLCSLARALHSCSGGELLRHQGNSSSPRRWEC